LAKPVGELPNRSNATTGDAHAALAGSMFFIEDSTFLTEGNEEKEELNHGSDG
jgi:hypothetical protein